MLIDTHAHLDMSVFDDDRNEVIQRAQKEGVGIILNVGPTLDGSIRSVELARQHDFIYAAVGIHPHDAETVNDESIKKLEELSCDPRVIAIGEIGLDYFRNLSPAESQQDAFRRQIQLAKKQNKPVVVHSREAKKDTIRILQEERAEEVGGILHCFSGDEELLHAAINMNFFISFAGQVTFPKALALQELVKKVPTDKILIETDCPYLAPQPKRGKRNEPAYVAHIAEKIASLRGVHRDDIERVVAANFHTLFGIGKNEEENKNISYRIRNSLYLNITNKCTNSCDFCAKFSSYTVQGHNLLMAHEPTTDELIRSIGDPTLYDEIVFCGFGEPIMRIDCIKEVSKKIKEKGGMVRVNTNGQGNLIHKRNILPELSGLVDSISISLNAENSETYNRICQPCFKEGAYEEVCTFITEAKKYIPTVIATVIDMPDRIDIEKCKKIATEDLGVEFRVRRHNMVGA